MKPTARILIIFTFVAFMAVPPCPPSGMAEQTATQRPGYGRDVFEKIIKPYRQINDYTAEIEAKVRMPGFRIPDFTATIYYKKPDKFHVETRGLAPIPKSSGLFNPLQFDPDKNTITFKQKTDLDGIPADVFQVEPRSNDTPIRYYTVWIGGSPSCIRQVESQSYRGTRALVKIDCRLVSTGRSEMILPEKVHIHISFPKKRQTQENTLPARDTPFSRGMARADALSGEGDVYIRYTAWRINTGLEDHLFTDPRQE